MTLSTRPYPATSHTWNRIITKRYAGAYAPTSPDHLVTVLVKQLQKQGVDGISIELAKERLRGRVEEWQPSRRVRIKLLAPGFPKRVLKTVKWLGDVYDMPIEAIETKLFEDAIGSYHLTIERLLPLRGDLRDGQRLYLNPRAFHAEERDGHDADSLVFQVTLDSPEPIGSLAC